jgi:hypothetical protein
MNVVNLIGRFRKHDSHEVIKHIYPSIINTVYMSLHLIFFLTVNNSFNDTAAFTLPNYVSPLLISKILKRNIKSYRLYLVL